METDQVIQIYRDVWQSALNVLNLEDWVIRPATPVRLSFDNSVKGVRFVGSDGLVVSRRFLLAGKPGELARDLRNDFALLLMRMATGQVNTPTAHVLADPECLLLAKAFGYDDEKSPVQKPFQTLAPVSRPLH